MHTSSKSQCLAVSTLCLGMLVSATPARADQIDPQACSITVEYTRNDTITLTYSRDFAVSTDAPYSEDFSTATRFRTFDATLSSESGLPVVKFVFDADVGVFDTVDLATSLTVYNAKGVTTSGNNTFWTSVPSSTGASTSVRHFTSYTLSCRKAK